MRVGALGLAAISIALSACVGSPTYSCVENTQCDGTKRGMGICLDGWCAYDDDSCERGLRFSPNAGDGLASQCSTGEGSSATATEPATSNPTQPGTTDADSEPATTSVLGSTSTDPCGACATPPSPCFQDTGSCDPETGECSYAPASMGTPCDDADACTGTSSCDGAGACVGSDSVSCQDPPSSCFEASGSCDPSSGTCSYDMRPVGSACEDGNACTVDDTCAADGTCTPGDECPIPDDEPCTTASCEDGACVYGALSDGSSCGGATSLRCCGGTCVDISTDEANCGACGLACDPALECESVAVTTGCASAPADVSGRCRCTGFNSQCPGGQICRTVSPFNNRCTPDDAADCPGTSEVVLIDLCPDYCEY